MRCDARTAIGAAAVMALTLIYGCGGGGAGDAKQAAKRAEQGGGAVPSEAAANATASNACAGDCADGSQFLRAEDVRRVIAQAAAEAAARNAPATVAVVDRVGNVLGVFRMADAEPFVTVTSTAERGAPVRGGLEGVNIIPDTLAAIAKAITGAYLSSEGNAFTTRTASQIVQEHFNPGELNQPSGPLFGVQFSQLPCGDFVTRSAPGAAPGPGPHRSPLGLAADPGGLPLYKGGTPVGGIGVIADGVYGLDKRVSDFDRDRDELIAIAGSVGFAAPVERRGNRVTVLGKTFRFTDATAADLVSTPSQAPPFARLRGHLQRVPGYYDGATVLEGTAFTAPDSGIRPAAPGAFTDAQDDDLDAFVFVDSANDNRFPPRAGTDTPDGEAANALRAHEVRQVLASALAVANRARAQIRNPHGSTARVTVAVVDSDGAILGMARARDAPIFGADVSLQKARTAAFFSGTGREGGVAPADALRVLPDPVYLAESPLPPDPATLQTLANPAPTFDGYVRDLQTFLGVPNALEADGPPAAFADRSGGNLSRPFYPDGATSGPPGPLSKPEGQWSVFSVGLQLDLVYNALINHVAFVLLDGAVPDPGASCTGNTGFDTDALFESQSAISGLANGIQIFPGSVPIYRGDTLIGGVGVSGDGVDQDDMIAFLGLHDAGMALDGAIGHAPPEIRADRLVPPGEEVRLRFVNCPPAPFTDTDEDDVCVNK